MQTNNNFNHFNNFYDKIYVITISRAVERQETIRHLLNGIKFSFFLGTDKNDWTKEKFSDLEIYNEPLSRNKHRYGKNMSIGEIAAACSHKQVYEDIIKNNYKNALIFEDDVIPEYERMHLVPNILEELPQDWEVFYWGYDNKNVKQSLATVIKKWVYHIQHSLGFLNWNHTMINNIFSQKKSNHISKAGYHDLIHAYAVTNVGAQKLLNYNTPIIYCADTSISYAIMNKIVKGYISLPTIFTQEVQVRPNEYKSLIKE